MFVTLARAMVSSRLTTVIFLVLFTLAVASAEQVPRRALLVSKEVGVDVDPVGVVRSTVISQSISFNFFCEFIKPLLDFEIPNTYC